MSPVSREKKETGHRTNWNLGGANSLTNQMKDQTKETKQARAKQKQTEMYKIKTKVRGQNERKIYKLEIDSKKMKHSSALVLQFMCPISTWMVAISRQPLYSCRLLS